MFSGLLYKRSPYFIFLFLLCCHTNSHGCDVHIVTLLLFSHTALSERRQILQLSRMLSNNTSVGSYVTSQGNEEMSNAYMFNAYMFEEQVCFQMPLSSFPSQHLTCQRCFRCGLLAKKLLMRGALDGNFMHIRPCSLYIS